MSVLPVHIEDVTAVSNAGVSIPLDELSRDSESDYNTEDSPGVVFRVEEPKATALVFSTGKIVCTGTKSLQDAEVAMNKVFEKLKSAGIEIKAAPTVSIEKIVAAFRNREAIDLDVLKKALDGAVYNTELNGVVYKIESLDAEFIILGNGKMICTSGKSIKDVQSAMTILKEKLESAGVRVELI